MSYAPGASVHEIVVTAPDCVTCTDAFSSATITGFDPTHVPPVHVSVCVHGFRSSHAVPFGSVGCVHVPVPLHWSAVHVFASGVHGNSDGSLFDWHDPRPSHVSGLSQSVFDGLPHAVPDGSWFAWQVPDPSHVSGLSHAVSDADPHAVPNATGVCTHELPLKLSVVHAFTSSQYTVNRPSSSDVVMFPSFASPRVTSSGVC